MNSVITIESRQVSPGRSTETVAARDLWTFLESKIDFHKWLFDRLDKYNLVADLDYVTERGFETIASAEGPKRRVKVDYFLTIEAAKGLAMAEANQKGREVREYFIECERRAKEAAAKAAASVPESKPIDPMKVLSDPAELRALLLHYAEDNLTQKAIIAEQAPKVQALARIATITQGSLCISDAAKTLQMSPYQLFQWMQSKNWIYRRSGTTWIAYQERLKEGVLEHKLFTAMARDGKDKIVSQVRVTPKGMTILGEQLPHPQREAEQKEKTKVPEASAAAV